ncbi:pre-mRNA 3'-end-processing factor FIP1 [Atheta coriaria]|uniref:pre-mRNA 3'-end-processing factor FIP1 n=1 Tax=Dalotia coriaria TaxID=877792 RepID=UPI0031F43504
MADDADNDDQWLYGDAPDLPTEESDNLGELDPNSEEKLLEGSDEEQQPQADEELPPDENSQDNAEIESDQPAPPGDDDELPGEEKQNGDKSEDDEEKEDGDQNENEDDEDDDSDDDDINVVIGDFKTTPTYAPPMNIKRGGLIATAGDKSKLQQPQTGKFTVDEFEQMGMINGVPAGEFSLDTIEDKPWRKPGSDITDYFNYGFNEDTWKAYCERQKRIRVSESGVGMVPLNSIGMPRGPLPIMNDNSKYSGGFTGVRKAGPPPGRRMTGAIDVIGGGGGPPPGKMDTHQPKENVIQVMTADRREYSRKPPGFPDLSMPPPATFEEYQPEFGFNPEPEPFYGGYEPTQDVQWAPSTNSWAPNQIKPLTPGHPHGPPPGVPPVNQPPPNLPPGMVRPGSHDRERGGNNDRERAERIERPERDDGSPAVRDGQRERDTESRARSEKPKDRERERSHRRERSRSRSRRHKSRSRSPSHRSHRKKKSRRHDDSE